MESALQQVYIFLEISYLVYLKASQLNIVRSDRNAEDNCTGAILLYLICENY